MSVLAGLHDHPADVDTGHVHVCTGIKLVDRGEDRFVGNRPSHEFDVIPVRSRSQQAPGRRYLLQDSRVCPSVDRTTPEGAEQHEASQLRLVLIDLRPYPVRRIRCAESLELRPERLRRGPLRRSEPGQPRLPLRLSVIHRSSMPHQQLTEEQLRQALNAAGPGYVGCTRRVIAALKLSSPA